MQLFKSELKIDFIGMARFWMVVSGIVLLAAVASFFTKGFNYGIDFLGGTAIEVKFDKKAMANADKIRDALHKIEMGNAMVQNYGSAESNEFMIKTGQASANIESHEDKFRKALEGEFKGENKIEEIRFAPDKMYITLEKLHDPNRLKKSIEGLAITDLNLHSVSLYGKESSREYLVEFVGITQMVSGALEKVFKKGEFEIIKVDKVGRKVGKELRRDAILAAFVALFFMLIYIWLRFEMEFAPGAVICLIHDAIITAGVFSLFGLEIDTTFVAAILTIVGYSINDTIVVYDRIRENMGIMKSDSFRKIINKSINQTLSRTVLTSITALFITGVILIYGGPILFNMALALTIGILIGTYSTMFIASPITLFLYEKYFSKKR